MEKKEDVLGSRRYERQSPPSKKYAIWNTLRNKGASWESYDDLNFPPNLPEQMEMKAYGTSQIQN